MRAEVGWVSALPADRKRPLRFRRQYPTKQREVKSVTATPVVGCQTGCLPSSQPRPDTTFRRPTAPLVKDADRLAGLCRAL
jgi:hypothetical protein